MSFFKETSLSELVAKASSGDWSAAQDLASIYSHPELFPHPEIAEENQAEAERWSRETRRLLLLTAEAGDKDAMFALALDIDQGANKFMSLHTEEAFDWMHRAASAGSAKACMVLSLVMSDKYNPHHDLADALKWSVKAAWSDPAGILDKQVPAILEDIRKLAEEVNGYYKDAQDGDPEAEFQMGHIFYFGHGVDPDPIQARDWWSKAAEQGHEHAKQMLSETEEN